jgi:endonuclease G
MKKLGLLLFVFTNLVFANPIDDKCSTHVIYGAPVIKDGNNQYLCRTGYAVEYNYSTKVADYVVETIKATSIATKSVSRKDDFREDTQIPEQYRVTLADYIGSGLDRGHMAPAADFVYDANVMSESFLLSNMMPQAPGNNRGIWKYLEEYTRTWASKYGQVYVISGTIFDDKSKTMKHDIKIPTYVYKIVFVPSTNKAIAFKFPNEKLDPKTIENYVVSISEIEQTTKINFFPSIPANLKAIETTRGNFKEW